MLYMSMVLVMFLFVVSVAFSCSLLYWKYFTSLCYLNCEVTHYHCRGQGIKNNVYNFLYGLYWVYLQGKTLLILVLGECLIYELVWLDEGQFLFAKGKVYTFVLSL